MNRSEAISSGDARHAARSGAVQVLTIIAQAVIAGTQVVFARLYGQAIYGSYLSALAVLEVLNRGGAGGGDKAMLRYVAAARATEDGAGVRSAIGTGLRLSFLVAGSFALLLFVCAPWLASMFDRSSLAPALRIMAPLPLLVGALSILIQASLAARTTRANFLVRGLAEPLLLLVGGVVAWLLGGRLRGLVTAHVTAAALTLVLGVLVVRRVLRAEETRRLLTAPWIKGYAGFALPIAASEMLNTVVQRADIVILTALKGVKAAALYGAAELITRTVANIRYAFDSIVAGVLSETLHLGEMARLEYNLRLTTRWVVSVAAPISVTVVVLREDLLALLFGASYGSAAAVLFALAAGHLVNAALGLTNWVLVVGGYSRLSFINNLSAAAFNVPAAYFLIERFGLVGASYATFLSTLLLQSLIVIEAAAVKKVHPFSAGLLKPIAAALAAGMAETALRAPLAHSHARIPLVIGAGLLTYAAVLLLLGLPAEERRLVQRGLRALGRPAE
ncbi:MAG TPA: oligosaccharide flippase family protein [Polyangia bacterium]|nr:oligosaccharide flippase family protein [Polyangia bacterium]